MERKKEKLSKHFNPEKYDPAAEHRSIISNGVKKNDLNSKVEINKAIAAG